MCTSRESLPKVTEAVNSSRSGSSAQLSSWKKNRRSVEQPASPEESSRNAKLLSHHLRVFSEAAALESLLPLKESLTHTLVGSLNKLIGVPVS